MTPDAAGLLETLAWHFDEPFADASALATAAQNYQAEQAKQGRTISMTDAVNHVKKGAQQ